MRIILIYLSIITLFLNESKGQNILNNLNDTSIGKDIDFINNKIVLMSQTLRLPSNPLIQDLIPFGANIQLFEGRNLIKNVRISNADTLLTPMKIFFDGINVRLIGSYELPSIDKGVFSFLLNLPDLKVIETKYYSFIEYKSFTSIYNDAGFTILKLGDYYYGAFNADSSVYPRLKRPKLHPVIFKINLINDTIQMKTLDYLAPSTANDLIYFSDSNFQFTVSNDNFGTKSFTFNQQLVFIDSNNNFIYEDTFLTSSLQSTVTEIKIGNRFYVATVSDTILHTYNPFISRSRASILITDEHFNPLKKRGFFDKNLENNKDEYRYSTGETGKSIAYINGKVIFSYHYYKTYKNATGNNKLYVKVLDTTLTVLKEFEFTPPAGRQLRAACIKCNAEACYIVGITLDTINYISTFSPWLYKIGMDSLTSNTNDMENKQSMFTIFPNPFQSKFNIQNLSSMPAKISLYNSEGKLLQEETINNLINVVSFDDYKGFFYYRITSNGNKQIAGILISQ